MEEDIKSIQKHMGGLVRTIIDLKTKVESLEERLKGNQKDDLAELMVKQKRVDEAITANSIAIQNIDDEIKVLSQNTKKKASIEVNQAEIKKEGVGNVATTIEDIAGIKVVANLSIPKRYAKSIWKAKGVK